MICMNGRSLYRFLMNGFKMKLLFSKHIRDDLTITTIQIAVESNEQTAISTLLQRPTAHKIIRLLARCQNYKYMYVYKMVCCFAFFFISLNSFILI